MGASKQKPVAVFDIDGTIIRSSLVIELTHELIERGVFSEDVGDEFRRAYHDWLNRQGSYEDYLMKLVAVFNRNMTHKRAEDIEPIAQQVAMEHLHRTYRYTRELVKQLKPTHFLIAISGSPYEIVKPFAKAHDFDDLWATEYVRSGGIYTDKRVLGHKEKDKTLKKLVDKHRLTFDGSVGVGDTDSDVKFLELVDRAIAFNPNQKLLSTAKSKKWEIIVERKDVIYRLVHTNGGYALQETDR